MPSIRRTAAPAGTGIAALALAVAALGLAACSGGAAGSATTTTAGGKAPTGTTGGGSHQGAGATGTTGLPPPPSSVVPPAGVAVAPADVKTIVDADSAVNNRANATFSFALQDGHETCLQARMDDLLFHSQLAAGDTSSSASFDQIARRPMVPREQGYPASFSVLASDVSKGQPTTTSLLTYVRTSAASRWKLASTAFVLGPTAAGVAVPRLATDAQGFAARVPGAARLQSTVAAEVASAFTQESRSGKLPSGVTAQFGPSAGFQAQYDPFEVGKFFAQIGKATLTYTTSVPPVAAAALAGPGCDRSYPAYRLADGGALVVFPIFQRLVLTTGAHGTFPQPGNRQSPFPLLPGGSYSEVTSLQADVCVAIVPPAGSGEPIQVIGQGLEPLSQTGVEGGIITT